MNKKDRRNLILDVSEKLFYEKGFEESSTEEIIKKADIARGTLYYYFAKKEDILDAVIERKAEKIFNEARKIAFNKNLSPGERLVSSIVAMKEKSGQEDELDKLHSPQNALMHQKTNDYILDKVSPFLSQIVNDGIIEGVFDTKYPEECIDMILIYANVAFDHLKKDTNPKIMQKKFEAFFYNIHKLLGARENSLDLKRIIG
ncbi:MAG: TetR/AcrR family transcriptional regulator [Tissierellia bacterium]|nr:TetR/AcrR family transcriptional regulator [Tissierellia bacterium]